MLGHRSTPQRAEMTVDAIGGVLVVTLLGDIEARCAEKFAGCLDQAAGAGRPVVVDLCDVTAFGPEAVEALVAGHRALGTRLRLVTGRSEAAWAELRRAGVSHLFVTHASAAAATSSAAPR
jgi:anti-anti-sigma regulatory factor